jgi:DNA-binding MarR family transcriptional regulator
MSTRLTNKGIPMVESQSLQLVFCASKTHEEITQYISSALKQKGYESATPSVLNFLSTLECGVNYGSEIARRLDFSRQMVAKIVKELCRVKYLEQVEGEGKQKQILFTDLGEHLMSDARKLLAELDQILSQHIGKESLQETIDKLMEIQNILQNLKGNL